MTWTEFIKQAEEWRAVVNAAMNINVPFNAGNFWTSWGSVTWSLRSLLQVVSWWVSNWQSNFGTFSCLWNTHSKGKGARCWWGSWLRHCAKSQKIVGSTPDGVIEIFHWHHPSGRTIALGSTQPLTEMSTRNISWGGVLKAAGSYCCDTEHLEV